MKYKPTALGCILLLLINIAGNTRPPLPSLKLVHAYPVECSEPIEPSGLTLFKGQLLTVSDDEDHVIFRLEPGESTYTARPFIHFDAPKLPGGNKLDPEGITCDSSSFYVVSEENLRILKVPADGSRPVWITENLKPFGQKAGLFQKHNANFEGIALLQPGRFILCAEREPRGIMTVDLSTPTPQIHAWNMNVRIVASPGERVPDFSGLWVENEQVYVLERGLQAVCRLEWRDSTYVEGDMWSYARTENRKKYRYKDMKYGHAEGLCMDQKYIFIILDNNGDARYRHHKDHRPLLFIFEKPF